MTVDALRYAAVARNRGPILEVLRRVLPPRGTVLEIASGSGEHALHFAAQLPHLTWQPTDLDEAALRSIAAYRAQTPAPNLAAPVLLDAAAPAWPIRRADAIVAINMIHIAPWTAAEGLIAGAGRLLPAGGVLYLYGPFKERDVETAPSNEAFDASLRQRDVRWGVRDLQAVITLAASHGLHLAERVAMPANNVSLIFRHGTN